MKYLLTFLTLITGTLYPTQNTIQMNYEMLTVH